MCVCEKKERERLPVQCVNVHVYMQASLTILASECRLYPDGDEEPLLVPLIGGPGIPGMLGTMFSGLASYNVHETHR